jgi:hypothetical protein
MFNSRKMRAVLVSSVFLGAAAILPAPAVSAAAAKSAAAVPDFSEGQTAGWISVGADWIAPASGAGPTGFDPAHPHVANNDPQHRQVTPRIADIHSPILQPWVSRAVDKANQEILTKGKIAFEAMSTCWPGGVPGIDLFTAEPVYFVQTPKEVWLLYQRGPNIRRIFMNRKHSAHVTPSWYGESVGHYEGDTLVVDTIGLSDKTFVDNLRTPHTTKLHVIERFHMINNGGGLEVDVHVEDPGAFTMPWNAVQRYRRVKEKFLESVCAENNSTDNDFFHLNIDPIPQAAKPDF